MCAYSIIPGNLETAKEMIMKAKQCGADCVKFQKSCLKEKFTKNALERPYHSENSFGSTYGEHKEFLEFSSEEYDQLKRFSIEKAEIPMTASAMDPNSIDFLVELGCRKIHLSLTFKLLDRHFEKN